MAALGHYKGLGTVFGIRIRGFFAWWLRRTYYLSVMPRWRSGFGSWLIGRLRDFRPDISKVDLGREQVARMRPASLDGERAKSA